MLGTKQHLKDYLTVIRPWAMGINERGWLTGDFLALGPTDANGNSTQVAREDVKADRTDPSHVIFPLVPYSLTVLDRLFLGRTLLVAVLNLNQSIATFNAALDAINRAEDIDTKWGRTILLHAGVIGTVGTGGLFERFTNAWRNL